MTVSFRSLSNYTIDGKNAGANTHLLAQVEGRKVVQTTIDTKFNKIGRKIEAIKQLDQLQLFIF